MITYIFLGITGVWLIVSAIVGAFWQLTGVGVQMSAVGSQSVAAPDNAFTIVGWIINSVAFFFKAFTFTITGAEVLSLVWVFMGIAWIYCLVRIIHSGGT